MKIRRIKKNPNYFDIVIIPFLEGKDIRELPISERLFVYIEKETEKAIFIRLLWGDIWIAKSIMRDTMEEYGDVAIYEVPRWFFEKYLKWK
jgi:hypothetical protein